MRLPIVAFVIAVASTARAEPQTADTCAATFPARHAEAKAALLARSTYESEYKNAGAEPVMKWFYDHCRYLDRDEIVSRKLDDLNAFVCTGKGRPAKLTAEFVAKWEGGPPPLENLMIEHLAENRACEPHDRSVRVPLVPPPEDGPAKQRVLWQADVICYRDERPSCQKLRAAMAELEAKSAAKPAVAK